MKKLAKEEFKLLYPNRIHCSCGYVFPAGVEIGVHMKTPLSKEIKFDPEFVYQDENGNNILTVKADVQHLLGVAIDRNHVVVRGIIP